jgi:uncharacterized NAD(P)/FAD-binding protein YdhS
VHRHRMAPRIATGIHGLIDGGRLEVLAARVRGYRACPHRGGGALEVALRARDGGERRFSAGWVINCTGPRRDLAGIGVPLLAELRDKGLASPDDLGLGLETRNGALLDRAGRAADWLFAIGPLTCPSWWEIVAVPEISVQIDSLVAYLTDPASGASARAPLSPVEFLDLGAGI